MSQKKAGSGKEKSTAYLVKHLEDKICQLETQTSQRNNDRRQLARFLAICAKKAGGKILLTKADLDALPTGGVLTRKDDLDEGSVVFGWKENGKHEY